MLSWRLHCSLQRHLLLQRTFRLLQGRTFVQSSLTSLDSSSNSDGQEEVTGVIVLLFVIQLSSFPMLRYSISQSWWGRRREERKAQLKAAAQDMKETGKAEAAFEESQYSVGDDK